MLLAGSLRHKTAGEATPVSTVLDLEVTSGGEGVRGRGDTTVRPAVESGGRAGRPPRHSQSQSVVEIISGPPQPPQPPPVLQTSQSVFIVNQTRDQLSSQYKEDNAIEI